LACSTIKKTRNAGGEVQYKLEPYTAPSGKAEFYKYRIPYHAFSTRELANLHKAIEGKWQELGKTSSIEHVDYTRFLFPKTDLDSLSQGQKQELFEPIFQLVQNRDDQYEALSKLLEKTPGYLYGEFAKLIVFSNEENVTHCGFFFRKPNSSLIYNVFDAPLENMNLGHLKSMVAQMNTVMGENIFSLDYEAGKYVSIDFKEADAAKVLESDKQHALKEILGSVLSTPLLPYAPPAALNAPPPDAISHILLQGTLAENVHKDTQKGDEGCAI
jgi:hypothetical protein